MTEKHMQGDVNPRKTFYIALSVDYLDGSCGVNWDGSQGFQELAAAVEHAKEEADQHGAASIIVECRPVKIVQRGPIRVTSVKPR